MASTELIGGPEPFVRPASDQVAPDDAAWLLDLMAALVKRALAVWLRALGVLGLAACLALPWMDQQLFWLGWIGLGGYMFFRRHVLRRTAALWTLFYALAALTVAFHWAPAAMAYTLDATMSFGIAVVLPILLLEAVRLALPFLLVSDRDARPLAPGDGESQGGSATAGPTSTRTLGSIVPRWLWVAAFAVALETIVPTVFPWRLGYLQTGAPVLNQLVPVFGPSIATLSVFAIAALVCGALVYMGSALGLMRLGAFTVRMENREAWSAAVFVAVNLIWGMWIIHSWEGRLNHGPRQQIALVQVDPSYTSSLDKMRTLTRQVNPQKDLVCWPESSIGCYSVELKDLTDRKHLFKNSRMPLRGKIPLKSPNCELLAGGKSYEGPRNGDGPERVSAYLVNREQRIIDRYDKTRLMPFGEYIPGAQTIPGLVTLFGFGDDPPLPGRTPRALTASTGARLGVMMCYEDMIPDVSRQLVRDGAEVLIVLINGTAFENPITLQQHRQLACFRALENRRYLLRTASTGSTCVIDPLGRCVAELPVQTEAVLQADVALLRGLTVFGRTGNLLGWTCVLASGFMLAGRIVARRRKPARS